LFIQRGEKSRKCECSMRRSVVLLYGSLATINGAIAMRSKSFPVKCNYVVAFDTGEKIALEERNRNINDIIDVSKMHDKLLSLERNNEQRAGLMVLCYSNLHIIKHRTLLSDLYVSYERACVLYNTKNNIPNDKRIAAHVVLLKKAYEEKQEQLAQRFLAENDHEDMCHAACICDDAIYLRIVTDKIKLLKYHEIEDIRKIATAKNNQQILKLLPTDDTESQYEQYNRPIKPEFEFLLKYQFPPKKDDGCITQ